MRTPIKLTDRTRERFGDTIRFRVRCNGILFEQVCHNHLLTEEKLQEINENFKNSIRIIKHHGGYFRDGTPEKDAKSLLESLSQTDHGIAIKVKNDPLKEFEPFILK